VSSGEATQRTSGSNSITAQSVTAVIVLKRLAPERRRKEVSPRHSPAPRIASSVPRLLTRICPRTSTKNE
jgi:hypothetical protein